MSPRSRTLLAGALGAATLAAVALVPGLAAAAPAPAAPASATAAVGPSGVDRARPPLQTDANSCDPENPGLGILQVWVPRSDVNEDRRVTFREFDVDADESFRTWDVDLDDRLTGPEADRLVDESALLLTTEGQRTDYLCLTSSPPSRSGTAGSPPAGGQPDLLAQVDADGDGAVTAAEWDASTRSRYDAINCDGNAFLSYAEAFRFGRQEGCP